MKHLLLSLTALLFVFGCAKKENNTTTTASDRYYYVTTSSYNNGYNTGSGQQICVDRTLNVQVDLYLCQNSAASSYRCVSLSNGQQVPNQYCQNSGYQCQSTSTGAAVSYQNCTSTTGTTAQQCVGQYYYNGTVVTCQTQYGSVYNNCSGSTLTNQYGQQVVCQ